MDERVALIVGIVGLRCANPTYDALARPWLQDPCLAARLRPRKDIVASPGGFGFESPRIIVEVKHRAGAMGSQQIRSFLGGRHPGDKGLYVSTGGFAKDAYYEAERANIPLTLLNLDDLIKALIESYKKLDIETQQLIPLIKVYVPA